MTHTAPCHLLQSIAQLTAAKAELERSRAELELALQSERAAGARPQTLAELRAMVAALQRELAGHKAKDQAGRGAVDKLAAATKEVHEAHAKVAGCWCWGAAVVR